MYFPGCMTMSSSLNTALSMISFSSFPLKLKFNPPENSDKPFDDMFNCLFIEPELNRLF